MAEIGSRSAASPSVSASASSAFTSTILTSVESTQDGNPPTTQFTSIQNIFNVINSTTGDFLVVTNVSPNFFTEIECERDKRRRKFRFRHYESDRQILFITIPTFLHEQLHIGLYQGYYNKLVRSGRENSWITVGTATYGGEGDSTGGPDPERGTKGFWPTLMIEEGDSELLSELQHQVKIVLLAKFEHTRRALILEKWEEEPSITRPGATTTRHAAALQPMLRQTITITEDTTTNPVTYNVASGALVLGFKLLFVRGSGPGEEDFVLSVQELQAYAERVWRML
ncbi:hypothetical protein N657DRAFT_666139 [Parathielavia appendiculata]|uniref:Uncharacterized protein n=1 Tax=Parathielavia appendiculata TaxID=2587402 RepID=A0AAN6TTQ8_9PEZI|nr:hypothetical protein N657DRAFT_666139 [Parathielavia appendiculata]